MSGFNVVVGNAFKDRAVGYLFTSNLVVNPCSYFVRLALSSRAYYQMYAYDWLLSISEEVELVEQSSLTWSIAIYFLSRYATASPLYPDIMC